MIELLQFIFRDFWTWLGTVILILTVGFAGFLVVWTLPPFVKIVKTIHTGKENESQ